MRRALRRAIASLLLLLLLLGGLGWAVLRYRPVRVPGPVVAPRAPVAPPGGWPRLPGMRLHVFNTGMLRMSPLLVGAAARWRPAPAFVLEHPAQGLVLYDSGMGPDIARRGEAALPWILRLLLEARALPERLLDAQMRAAGLDPARVTRVILSHAHFDHIGLIDAFSRARFVVGGGIRENHRAELSAAVARPLDRIPQARWQELWLAGRPAYATFDGSHDLFGDSSVVLVPGGGHTREDLLALLRLPGGPVLLAGDAVEDHEWLRADDVQRVPDLPERAAAVRNQVRALLRADPSLLLVPGHDVSEIPRGRADLVVHEPAWFQREAWP